MKDIYGGAIASSSRPLMPAEWTARTDAALEVGALRSVDSEVAILGAVSARAEWLVDAVSLESGDFWDPVLGRMWAQLVSAIEAREATAPATLHAAAVGDPGYQELCRAWGRPAWEAARASASRQAATSGARVAALARSIAALAASRRLVEALETATAELRAGAEGGGRDEARAIIEAALDRDAAASPVDAVSIGSAATLVLREVSLAADAGVSRRGLSTGIRSLDDRIGGLRPGALTILAGRPSMGKSAIGLSIALSAAQAGRGVLFVSLEMPPEQIAERALSSLSAGRVPGLARNGVPYSRLVDPETLAPDEREALELARRDLARLPLAIAGRQVRSLSGVSAELRRVRPRFDARGAPLGLIVIDYLQRLSPDASSRAGNREREVAEMAAGCKTLALQQELPVLCLAQLSRETERRDDRRPQLSDLRESGNIEAEADNVTFAYREAYYVERAEPERGTPDHTEWMSRMSEVRGVATIIVGKVRQGKLGSVDLGCDLATNRFWERD